MRSQKALRQCNEAPQVLSHDFTVEILSWLPVKSLLRFSFVCKSWKSLITDPYFVRLHLQRSATNTSFAHHRLMSMAYNWEEEEEDQSQRRVVSWSVRSLLENPPATIAEHLSFPLEGNNFWVVGSCNGLLCLASYIFTHDEAAVEYSFHLWNPATRLTSQRLPSFYEKRLMTRFCSLKFVFGYDHTSDTYKVVAVLFNGRAKRDSERCVVKVCSIGDSCWRKIQGFRAVRTEWQYNGVYLRGNLNWVAVRNMSSPSNWKYVTADKLLILSLDLGRETWRPLLWPHGLNEVPLFTSTISALAVLGDCFCVCHKFKETHFVVWQMKEFGAEKSWTLLVKLPYEILQTRDLLPLCLSESGDVLMSSTHSGKSEVILHKQRDSKVRRSEVTRNIRWSLPKFYVESLVLPC